MHIRFFGISLILVLAVALVSFGCGDDDDDDTILDDYPGGISGGGSSDDDDDTGDDDTGDDDTGDDDDDDERINLLIVHDGQVNYLEDYANIFYYYGIDSFELAEPYIALGDFTDIDVVLVDSSTEWFDTEAVARMETENLPMLGVYYGGGILFDALGMQVGWSGGEIDDFAASIDVVNSTHSVYTKPNNLSVSNGDTMTLFSTSTQLLYHDYLSVPVGVTVLGERSVGSDYAAIVAVGKSIYWGFDMDPYFLTTYGQQFLVNCIYYLSNL